MIGVRRRLFWKVYLTLLSSLIAVTALMGAFWWLVGERRKRAGACRKSVSTTECFPRPAVRRPRSPPRRIASPTR